MQQKNFIFKKNILRSMEEIIRDKKNLEKKAEKYTALSTVKHIVLLELLNYSNTLLATLCTLQG